MNQIPNIEDETLIHFMQGMYGFGKTEDTDGGNVCMKESLEWFKNLQQTHHHQLQKAREQRKGWKGYVAVDPQAGHYKYSPVFSDRKGAELWVKGKEISGLEVVEVDILLADHSELDQDKK